jgi:hypothetical protein
MKSSRTWTDDMHQIQEFPRTGLLALFLVMALSGCVTVQGVDEYQAALHHGCRPLAGGGVICTGDRG